MLTQSLENTYQNSKLSDKVRQVFVLSLIFLGICLSINVVSLSIIKFFIIPKSDFTRGLELIIKIDSWNFWVYTPIKISICFFLITSIFSFFRIILSFLIFIFSFSHLIINHCVFFTNLNSEGEKTLFEIDDHSWIYEWIYVFYLGYQDIISYYFPIQGLFEHGIYMPYNTSRFYITDILIPSLSFFLITFLTKKIYDLLRT